MAKWMAQDIVNRKAKKQAAGRVGQGGTMKNALRWLFAPGDRTKAYGRKMKENRPLIEALSGQIDATEETYNQAWDSVLAETAKDANISPEDITEDIQTRLWERTFGEKGAIGGTPEYKKYLAQIAERDMLQQESAYAIPNAALSYFSEGGLVKGAARVGVAAVGAGTAYRLIRGRGGPVTNERGEFDIAGVPFV